MNPIPDEAVLARLAAMAEEHDPLVKVVERRMGPQGQAYELVLSKGYYQETVAVRRATVELWLLQKERAGEADIRRLISAATDRLDERDYVSKGQGLWDWTGDRR